MVIRDRHVSLGRKRGSRLYTISNPRFDLVAGPCRRAIRDLDPGWEVSQFDLFVDARPAQPR